MATGVQHLRRLPGAAVRALRASAGDCVLVGDSLTDIEGARAAGVSVVGYANQPWKVEAFAAADAVITSMGEALPALTALSGRALQ
jgi:phosphoglycolate phosphatase-like HAD superfamily hydrolase